MIFHRMTEVTILSVMAALGWAALSQNRGWWFFLPLWLLILVWQHLTRVTLPGLRLTALPGFLWFFSRQLVLGAFDVGWRALALQQKLVPGWQHYPLSLSEPASQRLLASMISLLPGTCSAEIEQQPDHPNQLLLHVLDQHTDWQAGVAALEQQLTRLLRQEAKPGIRR
ncbi:Na+/H+ antiporter subunit E [Arsukibacterium sp.]|uniref:Na+/H+ antiporter subunit E n=1 Tax=Arsukibacterium sp. TaxID=1977258 RepID=UPI001BD5AAE5|nr:Na+/H+ antiporter subunit E [Arsukibacterium sp.]